MIDTAAIILAAGKSRRLNGGIKQLLVFRNKTLLQHTIDECLSAGVSTIIVVTGANAGVIEDSMSNSEVHIVFNENWEQGKASGIEAGVRVVAEKHTHIHQVIITACDQPFVSAALFRQLCETQQDSGKPIVASAYAGTMGIPALFSKEYFNQLMSLKGEEGAKKIFKANPHDLATVAFPQGDIDIDTQDDYVELLKMGL